MFIVAIGKTCALGKVCQDAVRICALSKHTYLLYARPICDVRPAPGRMQRIGGGGNGAANDTRDTAGAVGALR